MIQMKSSIGRFMWNCNGMRQFSFLLASSLVMLIFYYWMQSRVSQFFFSVQSFLTTTHYFIGTIYFSRLSGCTEFPKFRLPISFQSPLYTLIVYHSKNRAQNRIQEDPFWKLFEKVDINFTCDIDQGLAILRQISGHVVNLLPTTLYAVVQGHILHGSCTPEDIYTKPWNFSVGLGHNTVNYWLHFPYPPSVHPLDDPLAQLNGTRVSISLTRVLPNPVTDLSKMHTCMMTQLIFVGDSTLRGLVNELIETITHTLPSTIETHEHVTVANLGCVSLRYAYYPLFNRELDKQATFMDHVRALSETPFPAHEAIIVVGGVLWLNTTLLDELYEFITSKEFSGRFLKTHVVVKDQAAGFHSPISGLPSPFVTDRIRQAKTNNELITRAKQYGWTVLHSYNLTWTRVDHFLAYARCSCHFYQIQKKFTPTEKAMSYTVTGSIHHVLFRLFQQSILYGTHT
ncbi:hypothetical protein AHF37_01707 [Paragonimus kellicotti]|nr:hypothetical protein AHF37_01707 [Paragonimus kellicotti]